MSKKKALQDLRQDKIVQLGLYEKARDVGDVVGMRRARKKIEDISIQMIMVKNRKS